MRDNKKLNMINVHIPKELQEKIDAYWHKNQLNSRAEAIRQLVEIGLEQSHR